MLPFGRLVAIVILGLCLALNTGSALAEPADDRTVKTEINGVDGELLKNGKAHLAALIDKDRRISRYSAQQLLKRGKKEVATALQALGHYQATIITSMRQQQDHWLLQYKVNAGPRISIRNIDIEIRGSGKDLAELQANKDSFELKKGDPLHQGKYQSAKAALLKAAVLAGFLEARYSKSQLRVFPNSNKADVLLRLRTGPRYFFGDVLIKQDVLDPELVNAYVPKTTGNVFNSAELIKLQLALNDTDYFDRVDVDVDPDTATTSADGNKQVPVVVTLTPGKPQRYNVGVGFGSDTGPRFRLRTENRRVTKSGHQFNSDLLLSREKSELTARYQIPVLDLNTDRLGFEAGLSDERPADGRLRQQRFRLTLQRSGFRIRRTAYLALEKERFELGSDKGSSTLFMPGVNWQYVRADNRLRPKNGLQIGIDLHGAHDSTFSDTTFLQLQNQAKWVRGLGGRWRLLTRAELNITWLGENFSDLPASQRFFAGGSNSVRGYGFQSLGPQDGDGKNVGGQYLHTASAEVEYALNDSWAVAAFFDAGNASDELFEKTVSGAGLGIRWLLPFGQMRLDFAQPLDGHRDLPRVHFTLGPDL